MSISKFAVNYRRKDDKDHGYGNNLRKKMKNQKIEEEVEVEGRSNVKKKKMKTEEKDDKGHGSNLSKKTKNQKIEEKVEARSNLKKKTKTEKKKEKDEIEMIQISLPIELILEFLSRLPVKSLTRLSCTSKYLYNYINQNPQFTKSHFINYSQKNPTLVFCTNYDGTGKQQCLLKILFHTRDIQDDENDNHDVQLCQKTIHQKKGEFVGYCNGLICFRHTIKEPVFFFDVWNDTTQELLRIIPPVVQHRKGGGINKLMSCGFGFDSINNEYKLVIIVFMFETKSPKCFVFTFGIKSSWTEIRSPNSGLLRTCASAVFTSYGAAGAGGGALFWWTTDPQVILLFDLHENKLQYIRIPLERDTHTRRFEHKGFLVVARLEKKSPTTLTLGKVHLKILKAYKDDQVWAEETIDLSAYSIPFSSTFRFMSFSDQILLYWVDAKNFHFFNLQKRCLKVVRNLDSCISEKMLPTVVRPYDYWLNCEVENICALRTLLPARAQISDRAALNSMMKKNFENMWTLQQPKTVGGIFSSYYKSKTNSHYFFDD